jgi:hypothetical protein
MLIYCRKLRFLANFCLALAASPTFFNSLLSVLFWLKKKRRCNAAAK